jgi:hypothetical protein
MNIVISEEKNLTSQTITIFLVRQKIRLIWHESETGVINWNLDLMDNPPLFSKDKRKKGFSFTLDGSENEAKGWLDRSITRRENHQNYILLSDTHIQS